MKRFFKLHKMEIFDHEAFKVARVKAKITQAKLAAESGTSTGYICDLEAGRRGILPETAERLIAALERLGG